MTASPASASTRRLTGRLTVRVLAAATALPALALLPAPAANADDMGGVANPTSACPGGYTVKSADIHDRRNQTIGRIDLRWASSCGGNWARTTSYVGKQYEIESRVARGTSPSGPGGAYSVDYNVSQNWTFYISILPSDPACAKGSIFYNGFWTDATVCAAS